MKMLSVILMLVSLNAFAKKRENSKVKQAVVNFETKVLVLKNSATDKIGKEEFNAVPAYLSIKKAEIRLKSLRRELSEVDHDVANVEVIEELNSEIEYYKELINYKKQIISLNDEHIYELEKLATATYGNLIEEARKLKQEYNLTCGIEKRDGKFVFVVNDEIFDAGDSLEEIQNSISYNYSNSFELFDCKTYQPIGINELVESIYNFPLYEFYKEKGKEFDSERSTANDLEYHFEQAHERLGNKVDHANALIDG